MLLAVESGWALDDDAGAAALEPLVAAVSVAAVSVAVVGAVVEVVVAAAAAAVAAPVRIARARRRPS